MRLARWALISILLASAPPAVGGADSPFKHDWRFEQGGTLLISMHPAPPPFSLSGEPEATLQVEVSSLPAGRAPSVQQVVKNEIEGIRSELKLAEYLEQDGHKPDRGIASWFQEVAGYRVGFIRYRAAGTAQRTLAQPWSVTHAIAVKDGHLMLFHLRVLYAGHQAEVRADQLRLIELMLPAFRPGK